MTWVKKTWGTEVINAGVFKKTLPYYEVERKEGLAVHVCQK